MGGQRPAITTHAQIPARQIGICAPCPNGCTGTGGTSQPTSRGRTPSRPIAVGDLADARLWLNRYEDLAKRSTSPWALATAARCRGLLSAAEGDLGAARAALDRALAEHDRMLCPFERGRTLLAVASIRRRGRERRSAREALDQAHQAFDDLGARLWADRARDEAKRISGRRPASGELTATEAQLASLAACGHANKEIAAALHISVHTVEAHLTRIYRKLGVRSRAELAGRLHEHQAPSAPIHP